MTVSVDKKTIHLGWPAAGSILVFLVVTVFGFGSFTTKFMQKQDDIYRATLRMQRRDSIQAVINDTMVNSVYFIKHDVSGLTKRVENLEKATSDRYRNYTERKVGGKLQYNRADK